MVTTKYGNYQIWKLPNMVYIRLTIYSASQLLLLKTGNRQQKSNMSFSVLLVWVIIIWHESFVWVIMLRIDWVTGSRSSTSIRIGSRIFKRKRKIHESSRRIYKKVCRTEINVKLGMMSHRLVIWWVHSIYSVTLFNLWLIINDSFTSFSKCINGYIVD